MNNIYINLFYIFIVLGSVCLIASAFIFFYFNIVKVIGDLSGKTSQKAIQKSREINKHSGVKQYKPSPVNAQRGRITDKINGNTPARNIEYGEIRTDPIGTSESTTFLESHSAETTVLDSAQPNATTVLDSAQPNATTVLAQSISADATTVLTDQTVNTDDMILNDNSGDKSSFMIEESESFSDSAEVIV